MKKLLITSLFLSIFVFSFVFASDLSPKDFLSKVDQKFLKINKIDQILTKINKYLMKLLKNMSPLKLLDSKLEKLYEKRDYLDDLWDLMIKYGNLTLRDLSDSKFSISPKSVKLYLFPNVSEIFAVESKNENKGIYIAVHQISDLDFANTISEKIETSSKELRVRLITEISSSTFTKDIVNKLRRKHKEVTILKYDHGKLNNLFAKNKKIKFNENFDKFGFMHNKFIILEGEKKLIFGSANPTFYGARLNYEFVGIAKLDNKNLSKVLLYFSHIYAQTLMQYLSDIIVKNTERIEKTEKDIKYLEKSLKGKRKRQDGELPPKKERKIMKPSPKVIPNI